MGMMFGHMSAETLDEELKIRNKSEDWDLSNL